eukprot:SAG22_NODE_82_length_21749_cov_10.719769_8_plen_173_part_00
MKKRSAVRIQSATFSRCTVSSVHLRQTLRRSHMPPGCPRRARALGQYKVDSRAPRRGLPPPRRSTPARTCRRCQTGQPTHSTRTRWCARSPPHSNQGPRNQVAHHNHRPLPATHSGCTRSPTTMERNTEKAVRQQNATALNSAGTVCSLHLRDRSMDRCPHSRSVCRWHLTC